MRSVKNELIKKSRESMLCAVQTFNNPNISFKTENFIVLAIISWTYLLHAYYRSINIEYRYYEKNKTRKKFAKTKNGAYKYWELGKCVRDNNCPLDISVKNNLLFLTGIRHEIEHQMTGNIDEQISAKLQACCLNYNDVIIKLFGEKYRIDKYLSFSIQLSTIETQQIQELLKHDNLPKNINSFICNFEETLNENEFNDNRYAYRVCLVPIVKNNKGGADRVIEFVKADSEAAKGLNKELYMIKESEKQKYLPMQIVREMNEKGYSDFTIRQHTQLWKNNDAKDENKGYGTKVVDKWHWYQKWVDFVENHLKQKKII